MYLKKLFALLAHLLCICSVSALFEYCDYKLNLNASAPRIYINSPNYPNQYPSGSSCRFVVQAPDEFQINFNCRIDFDKNTDNSCSTENFYYNSQGLKQIPGSEFFCGRGNFLRKSSTNMAVLSYISMSSNLGGWFSCLAEIAEKPCDCGCTTVGLKSSAFSFWHGRIVGGNPAARNEFPSAVAIVHLAYQRIFCGATIIHRKYLLSAAHCYSSNETSDPEELNALVGENDITTTEDSPYTRLYEIESIISHEEYDPEQVTNDIAILRMAKNIDFNNGVCPACLPFKFAARDLVGSKVTSVGWGTTSFGGFQSNVLLKVNLDIISIQQCQVQIKNLNFGQFCTFTRGKDACQFDSGGGLYYKENGKFYVVGIVSFGFSCATTFPSVNTRVSTYSFWIQNKLSDVKFCMK